MGNPVVHFELNGTDWKSLAGFYKELFGWHVQDIPEGNYAVIDTHAGSGINGGIGQSQTGEPFGTFYVEGPDVQALLDKAESLGGKTVVPVVEMTEPFPLTFAQFADPQGNRIGLVKSDDSQQGGVSPGDGVGVSWFEIIGPDPKALVEFYGQLFGWKEKASDPGQAGLEDVPGGFEYHQVKTEAGKGIDGAIGSSPDGQGHVTVYAEVDDIQKYLEVAESLGGKTVVPVTTIAQTTFAQFADPQGIVFGLFKARM
jgi:predicted enzyme related to lactoylglutathione lyase